VTDCHCVGPIALRGEIAQPSFRVVGDRYDVSLLAAHGNHHGGGDVAATDGCHAIYDDAQESYWKHDADDGCHAAYYGCHGDYAKMLLPVLFSHVADQIQHQLCVTSKTPCNINKV